MSPCSGGRFGSGIFVRRGPILWAPEARRTVRTLDAHDGTPLRRFAAAGVDHAVQADSGFVVADSAGRLALVDPDPGAPQYSTHSRRITQRIRVLHGHGPGTVLVLTKGTLRVVEVDTTSGPIPVDPDIQLGTCQVK